MMTSHLPADLEEEILSRVPATSLMRWRSICRRWNTLLFENKRFSDKHLRDAPKQSLVLMLTEYRLFFVSVDLKFVPPSIEFSDALGLKNYNISEYAHIITVSHCDGLLLCTTLELELVVWNPCTGQTRWIRDHDGGTCFLGESMFTLGYGNNNQSCRRSYKILMEMWVTNNMDDTCDEAEDLSWTKSFTMDFCLDIFTGVLIDEDKKVALCDSPREEVACTIGEKDEYYSQVPFEGACSRHEHIFHYVPSLVQFPQQSIESDGFGKCHYRRWWGYKHGSWFICLIRWFKKIKES